MPIVSLKDAQKRATEVGRIRLGIKTTGSNGKERPQKLSTLRFTSAAKHLIDEIGRLYGGEVKPWQAPSGPQWEVITETNSVPVYVARQLIDPWYEAAGNGYITRRCDGETETKRNVPCMCSPENRDCKPTTRLKVYLADVPGNGVFRLESHGWNAAEELGGDLADWIALLPNGIRLPGLLRVEPRREKKLVIVRGEEQIKTFDYMVPVLHFDQITSRQIAGGPAAYMAAIGGGDQAAIEAGPAETVRAIAGAPAVVPDYVRLANDARDAGTVRDLYKQAHQAGHLNDNLIAHLQNRVLDLEPPEPTDGVDWAALIAAASTVDELKPIIPAMNAAGVTDPALRQAWWARKKELEGSTPVASAEGEVEPDRTAVWSRILHLGSERGWNLEQTAAAMKDAIGKDQYDADGWAMSLYADQLAGQVTA